MTPGTEELSVDFCAMKTASRVETPAPLFSFCCMRLLPALALALTMRLPTAHSHRDLDPALDVRIRVLLVASPYLYRVLVGKSSTRRRGVPCGRAFLHTHFDLRSSRVSPRSASPDLPSLACIHISLSSSPADHPLNVNPNLLSKLKVQSEFKPRIQI
ncbi:hypothetical protein MSAN_02356200 [Mycena sanguinolenta]|uniref:Uncharacterized protein n=1 Tax=Mycena sanguinolenta TaxID=230812 RepID=A0A8H6X5T0_9AGAR|nr:hypothetical protein MSAN_02356200 [Mycena sanguinolenta]